MADIPDQPGVRRVENVMQRDGQLDDAETSPEMPAGDRYRVDQFGAQFVGDLPQIGFGKAPQIGRGVDPVKERRPVRDSGGAFIQGTGSCHVRRLTTNRATCRNSSARLSNNSRWAMAWPTRSWACARARSTPRIETNVALPAAASAPTAFPVSAATPSTSSRSSAIWKARPRSWA